MIFLGNILSIILVILGCIYIRQIFLFINGIKKLRKGTVEFFPTITVIVPARNEEKHIGDCVKALLLQDYPKEKFTIVVVDDQSSDNTAEVVGKLAKDSSRVRLVKVENPSHDISPKINALMLGIAHTTSDIIFTTDADCVAGPQWLSSMMKHFSPDVGIVTGTTTFYNKQQVPPLLFGVQFLDFLSQTACAAGAIGNGEVNNCNGSNMSFRRSAYDAVGGYSSLAHLNSGDDSLLAQQIVSTSQWKIRFAIEPESQVTTFPVEHWKDFLQQRMRWAVQTAHYQPATLTFLVTSFLLYILLFVLTPFSIVFFLKFPLPVIVLCGKFIIDYWILKRFTALTKTSSVLKFFFPAEIFHIPTVLLAVFGGYFGHFEWKGRTLMRAMKKATAQHHGRAFFISF
jgi:cellulose synthase/poly-beta-1,6-N-acetylglucosamine synthase-like glycosyltransferase